MASWQLWLAVVLALLLVAWITFVLLTWDLSKALAWALKTCGGSVVPKFECSKLTIIPFDIRELDVAVELERMDVRVLVKWDRMEVRYFGFSALFEGRKMISVSFVGFDFVISGITFEDVLGVSPSKLQSLRASIGIDKELVAINRIQGMCMAAVDFKFVDARFKFHFKHPENLVVVCAAAQMDMYCVQGPTQVVDCHLVIASGSVLVLNDAALVIDFWCGLGEATVQLLSSAMDMNAAAAFPLKNFVELDIQPFLKFFNNYQVGDDDSIEAKITHGLSGAGKMKLIQVDMPLGVHVLVHDARAPVPIAMNVYGVDVTMTSQVSKAAEYPSLKTISAVVKGVDFVGLHSSVYDVNVSIHKTVRNTGDHIDSEDMVVSVGDVRFHKVDPLFLNWLCILQHTSDKIPSSRFSHPKHSTMSVRVDSVYFTSGYCDADVESWQACHAVGITVGKISEAGTTLSTFTIGIEKLNLRTEYCPFNMLQRYSFKMMIDGHRYGFIYTFDDMKIVFDLAENLDIKLVAAASFKFSHSSRSCCTQIVLPLAVEPDSLPRTGRIISLVQSRVPDEEFLDEEIVSESPGIPFFLCHGFAFRCPAADKTEITMDTIDATLGILSYMRMMYSISETRAFVSRSVDGLLKAKLYVPTNLSFDPRDLKCKSIKAIPFVAPPPPPSPPKTSSYRFLVKSRVMEIRVPVASVSDTGLALSEHVGSIDSGWNVIDVDIDRIICRGKGELAQRMHLLMRFDDFSFENQGTNTNITGWSSLRLSSSADLQYPFMHVTEMTIRSVDNPLATSKTAISMRSLSVRVQPTMHLGLLLELLLQQRDAFKLASEPPTEGDSQGNITDKKDLAKASPETLMHDSILTVNVAESMRFSFDCVYGDALRSDFCVIEIGNVIISMKSSHDSAGNNLAVRALDDEPVQITAEKKRFLRYGGFNGGDVRISFGQVTLRFLPEMTDYVYVKSITMTGKLLMGTVINSKIAKNSRKTVFSDDFDYPNWFAGLEVHSSAAPTKFFGDICQSCQEFKLNLHPNAGSYMPAWLKTIDTAIPPSTDPSPPLMWYDNIRYWVHGRTELKINKFQVAYSVSGMAHNVLNLYVKMHRAHIKLVRDTVELKGRDFSINAEILDKYAVPRRSTQFPLRKHFMRSQLFLIPSLALSFSHKRKDFMLPTRQYCSHHDVYMNPANPHLKDRFYYYRTRRASIIWAVYVKCSCLRRRDQNVSFFGRMDVLLRVIDILQRPAADPEDLAAHRPSSTSQNCAEITTSRPFATAEVGVEAVKSSSDGSHVERAASPDVAFSLTDAAHALMVYASIDNFMACSWPSAHNLSGIVLSQDGLQLQLKMERGEADASKSDNSIGSLDIQSLHLELDRLEIYARNWAFNSMDRESKHLGLGKEPKPSRTQSSSLHSDEFEAVPLVRYMYRPINKLMHTTKVIMFLKPDIDSTVVDRNVTDRSQRFSEFGGSSLHEAGVAAGDQDVMWRQLQSIRLSNSRPPQSAAISNHLRDKRAQKLAAVDGNTSKFAVGSPSNLSNFGSVFSGRSRMSDVSFVRPLLPSSKRVDHLQRQSLRDPLLEISDFSRTHALAHPPPSALPPSYRTRVIYEHSRNILDDMVQPDRYDVNSYSSLYAWSSAKQNSAYSFSGPQYSSASEKIWNLKIVDMRLLWTVRLRDLLADYVSHYYEIKMHQDAMFAGLKTEADERDRIEAEKLAAREQETKSSRATVNDFMDLAEEAAVSTDVDISSPVVMISRTRTSSETEGIRRGRLLSGADRMQQMEESDLEKLFLSNNKEEKTKPDATETRRERRGSSLVNGRRKSDAMKLAELFQLESNAGLEQEHDPILESAVGKIKRRNSNFGGVQVPAAAKSSKNRSQAVPRRQSLLYRDIKRSNTLEIASDATSDVNEQVELYFDDNESLEQPSHPFSTGNVHRSTISPLPTLREDTGSVALETPQSQVPFAESSLVKYKFDSGEDITLNFEDEVSEVSRDAGCRARSRFKMSSPDRRSLTSPLSEITDLTASPPIRNISGQVSKTTARPLISHNSFVSHTDRNSKQSGVSSSIEPTTPLSSASSNRRYFIVELIDPQVNFMDERAQGSLLIVAGLSSLEGTKGITASIPIQAEDDTPQRENTLSLIMDGVSAFTVATNEVQAKRCSDGSTIMTTVDNMVHWKAMDYTMSSANQQMRPARRPTKMASRRRSQALQRFNQSRSIEMEVSSSQGIAIGEDGKEKLVNNLMVAIEDFQIKALYTFYENVPPEDVAKIKISREKKALVNLFMLDLPALILDMNSTQFYIFLNVVSNVLLAPPPKTSSSWKESKAEEKDVAKKEMKVITLSDFDDEGVTATAKGPILLTLNNRTHRDGILRALEGHLIGSGGGLDEVDYSLARHIEYFVGRGVWRLRSLGPSDASFTEISTAVSAQLAVGDPQSAKMTVSNKDMIEVGFMGLFGAHTFHEDRCSTNIFEVQRFWARNVDSSSLHSEKDAAINSSAEVKSSVLMSTSKTATGPSITSDWVIVPHLLHADPCTRCGRIFSVEHNTSESCCFHADTEGRPGEFKYTAVGSGRLMRYVQMWTCCGATEENALGCSRRPHVCKEIMLTIRAEATPTVLVENVEVAVFKTLEISVFPGALYEIRLQITRSVVDLLHKYFSLKAELLEDDPKADNKARAESMDSKEVSSASEIVQEPDSKDGAASGATIVHGDSAAVRKNESAIYIKYMRVGEINVEVSTSGFPLNLESYKAVVEPYVRHSKVLDWQRLIWKLEKHATWSVTKHTASKGFANMWKVIFPSAAEVLGAKQREAASDPNNIIEYVNEDAGYDERAAVLLGIKKNILFV